MTYYDIFNFFKNQNFKIIIAADGETNRIFYNGHQTTVRNLPMGVDRLDYTKGIKLRLRAIDKFFEKNPGNACPFPVCRIGN